MTNAPDLIPGLHYFCDHCCWRCGLANRCAVFARWIQTADRPGAVPSGAAARVAATLAISLEVTMEEVGIVLGAMGAPPLHAAPARTMGAPPGLPAAGDADPRARARAEQHPLVARGAEYARQAWPVLKALRPILERRQDREGADALERIEEICVTIASKIFRAISGSLDGDYDDSDVQTDANGSAKVALILIEESQRAWRVLMQPGRGAADGAPARFIALLDNLEQSLLARFPKAFQFVRPGFDTADAPGEDAAVARALLKLTTRN